MNKISNNIMLFIAQGACSGRAPFAPGTAGTLVGVLLYLGIKDQAPFWYGAVCAIVTLIGTPAAGRAECILGKKDAPSIVIDEIAGYLIAMALVPFSWWAVAAGFFLFRFFDILKPWPLFRLQDLSGGAGVMADDIGAGIYTNVVLQIANRLIG